MTPRARRIYPLSVFLAGVLAAVVIVPLAGQSRRADRAQFDRRVVGLAATAVHNRADAIARGVRGPALSFDLGALTLEEVTGLLRLAYAQNDGVAAVTLLDRAGEPVSLRDRAGSRASLPAVFLPRAGTAGDAHPVESLDDLEQFSARIPHAQALAHGRAVRGPYASVRGNGSRVAVAEAVPVADGTDTWVLAAEVDAARLLEGLVGGGAPSDGEVALVTPSVTVGALARVPEEARAAIRAASRRARAIGGVPELLAGPGWRAAVVRAPDELEGVVAMAWSGDEEQARRARAGELALGVIVVTIVGALAAALYVAMREAPLVAPDSGRTSDAAPAVAREGRVLGAVVKELANPIAAASAAARLLGSDPTSSAFRSARVVETLQRSVLRTERAFRRVARLTRAGEERAHAVLDVVAIAARETEAARGEVEQAGLRLETVGLGARGGGGGGAVEIRGDEEDLALLLQVLLDGARSLAPHGTAVRVAVRRLEATGESGGGQVELAVSDAAGATLPARERRALVELGEGARTETAAPVLAWALAARIAADHGAEITMRDETDDGRGADASETGEVRRVAAVVTFDVYVPRSSGRPPAPA